MSSEPADTVHSSPPDGRAPPPIAGNTVWRLGGTVARILVGVVAVSIYARVLGMEQWGLLALFQAATAPLAVLELGGGTAAVKYVAESVGHGDRDGAVRVLHTNLLFNLGIGVAGAAALNAAARWLSSSVFAIPPPSQELAALGFRVASLGWVTALIAATFLGALSAHQRYDWVSKLGTGSTVASAVLGVCVALAGGNIVGVLVAQITVSAMTALAAFGLTARLLPGVRSLPRWDPAAFRRSFSFGSWQAVAMLGGLLANWSDRYILGARLSPAMVGFYAVALSLEAQLFGTFHELGEVLFPAVSHRQGSGRLPDARRLALLGGWALSTLFGVFAATLAAVGGDFLHLWISAESARRGTAVLRILCVAGTVGMGITGLYYYMLGTARTRWAAALAVTTGAITVPVSVILVPRIGLAGVAVGALCGMLSQWLLAAVAWRADFRADVSLRDFMLHVFAPPLTSIALLGAAVWMHDRASLVPSWPLLVAETAAALAVVGAAQLAVGELLPGGRARRTAVMSSFAPVVASIAARVSPKSR